MGLFRGPVQRFTRHLGVSTQALLLFKSTVRGGNQVDRTSNDQENQIRLVEVRCQGDDQLTESDCYHLHPFVLDDLIAN